MNAASTDSGRKPVVAVFADFPAIWVDDTLPMQDWHHSPMWLSHLRDFFAEDARYEVHWIIFSRAVRTRGFRTYHKWNQTFHLVPRISLKWDQRTGYLYTRAVARLLLQKIKPDIVHAWGTEVEYAIGAVQARCRKIISMQGILTAYIQRSPMDAFFLKQEKYEQEAMRRCDVITSESAWGCDRVREIAPGKPVVQWEYAPSPACYDVERRPAEHPYCIMAGTDSPVKNLETAIRAFSAPELSQVELWLAGASPEKHPNLPPNVKALGGLPREELLKLLGCAWCLVHPSLADTSPNIVKESRVIGLPVVLSCETGGTRYVEDGKSGFIVQPRDVEAIKRGVLRIVAQRQNAIEMGEHGQAECRRLLSAETMRAGLFALYERVLNGKL